MLFRESDKDGPEGLLKWLDIAIEGMCQKTPPYMEAIPGKGQDTNRTTFNKGGIGRKIQKKDIVGKTLNFLEHKKTPYFTE